MTKFGFHGGKFGIDETIFWLLNKKCCVWLPNEFSLIWFGALVECRILIHDVVSRSRTIIWCNYSCITKRRRNLLHKIRYFGRRWQGIFLRFLQYLKRIRRKCLDLSHSFLLSFFLFFLFIHILCLQTQWTHKCPLSILLDLRCEEKLQNYKIIAS